MFHHQFLSFFAEVERISKTIRRAFKWEVSEEIAPAGMSISAGLGFFSQKRFGDV